MKFSMQQCHSKMQRGDMILAYKGGITSDLITNILGIVELQLDNYDEKPAIKKRVYNVLVESLQNLYHHMEADEGLANEFGKRFGLFFMGKTDDNYYISTGNFVRTSNKVKLKGDLDKINKMNRDELKDYYKFVLNNQKFSNKGGGGLGLIDIARRTRNSLEYYFLEFNDDYDFYILSLNVLRN